MLASWETGLGCPVTAPRDTRLACRAAGAEGWLPWHIWTGAGRSWAAWAALTPRGPPAAPRLPNFAAEPGQLLPPCPRSAALRSPSRSPRLPRSLLLLACATAQPWECRIPSSPRTQQGPFPQVCARDSPAPAQPSPELRAQPWHCQGDVGCPPRASQMCNEQQPCVPATPGHTWPRGGDGDVERPPCPLLLTRLREKRQRTQPAFTSVIFLILFMSKMTKTKPSAPGPSPCLRRRAGGPRAPRPCALLPARRWVQAGVQAGHPGTAGRLLCARCQERGLRRLW